MKAVSCYLRTRCGIRRAIRWVGAILLRSVVLMIALVSLALPALAQGDLNKTQKRKALLPAVRATTECIAQEILRSPTAQLRAPKQVVRNRPEHAGGVQGFWEHPD